MKILRKVFLYLSLFDFANFIILRFAVKWDVKKCGLILGVGAILLGISFIFELVYVEKEKNKVDLFLRKTIFGILLCGFALCFCSFL